MSRHLLIDFDSTIPNLALMKVSRYFKERGDVVWLNHEEGIPDFVWLSCIFTWNKARALETIEALKSYYPTATIYYGGTGFDWGQLRDNRIELPLEIERVEPDYSLYNDPLHRAFNFCQRGCNRKCSFCDVPKKEGRIDPNTYRRVLDWVPDDVKRVVILDNDMALYEEWKHDEIILDCANSGRGLSISQGYDVRTLNPRSIDPIISGNAERRAQLLAEHKPYDLKFRAPTIYIAWDFLGVEDAVRIGIELLLGAGFKSREIMVYTIVGFESDTYKPSWEQYFHRHKVLAEEYGVYPFVMLYNHKDDPMLRNFARWTNARLYKKRRYKVFEDFLATRGMTLESKEEVEDGGQDPLNVLEARV